MNNIKTGKYVIGIIRDRDIWFYVGDKDEKGATITYRESFSSALDDAKKYIDENILRKELEALPASSNYKIIEVRRCPKCKKNFIGCPAISREDNKTEICSECGTREALMRYYAWRM